jgi:2-amino-4-hydroxy-6-hydroxymethyldihydropteridine diphosphokinase
MSLPSSQQAFIALGSNRSGAGPNGAILTPAGMLRAALAELDQLTHSRLQRASLFYRSPAWNPDPTAAAQPDYLNAAVELSTELEASALLQELHAIERRYGRVRESEVRNAARTLDLDLLLCGSLRVDQPNLTLPHPRLHQRAFVLRPLLDIAPDLSLPTASGMRALKRYWSELPLGEQNSMRLNLEP